MYGTKTFLTGLLGEGIAASRSPEIHQREAKATLVFSSVRRIGYNTDWNEFTENFKRGLADVAIQKVVQMALVEPERLLDMH